MEGSGFILSEQNLNAIREVLAERERSVAQREIAVQDREATIEQNVQDRLQNETMRIITLARKTSFLQFHPDLDIDRLSRALNEHPRITAPLQVRATIKGSKNNRYTVTLNSCTCSDFQNRNVICKHMYRLALELGLLVGHAAEQHEPHA